MAKNGPKMTILGHFGPNWDILWAQPGQNGQKMKFSLKVKNVGKNTLKPSQNVLERFRKVLGGKKCFISKYTHLNRYRKRTDLARGGWPQFELALKITILKIMAISVLAMGDGPKNSEKIRRLRRANPKRSVWDGPTQKFFRANLSIWPGHPPRVRVSSFKIMW